MQACSRKHKNEALLPGQGGYSRANDSLKEAYDEAK